MSSFRLCQNRSLYAFLCIEELQEWFKHSSRTLNTLVPSSSGTDSRLSRACSGTDSWLSRAWVYILRQGFPISSAWQLWGTQLHWRAPVDTLLVNWWYTIRVAEKMSLRTWFRRLWKTKSFQQCTEFDEKIRKQKLLNDSNVLISNGTC